MTFHFCAVGVSLTLPGSASLDVYSMLSSLLTHLQLSKYYLVIFPCVLRALYIYLHFKNYHQLTCKLSFPGSIILEDKVVPHSSL